MARWRPSNFANGNLPNGITALAAAMENVPVCTAWGAEVAKRPNIVLILADDMDCLTVGLVEKCVKLLRIPTVFGPGEVQQTSVN